MTSKTLQVALALEVIAFGCGADWRQFRGTHNNSVSVERDLPKTFGEAENIAWKAPLPGRGPSGPIVIGKQVVVTASSGFRGDRLHVLCFDSQTGAPRWERQLWATGHTLHNPFGAVACNTPASDGELIFAFYSSNDLACFDLDGNLKWFRGLAYDYPTMRNDVGMGSSPLVVGDTVIVQCENQGASFIAGLDKRTGETVWRHDRDHEALWSSPTVWRGERPEDDLVLFHGRDALSGHDPRTGEVLWKYEASCHTIATATTDRDRIYLPANGIHALRYDSQKRTATLLWYEPKLRGGNASPVATDDRVYVVKPPAILVCADAADGRILWQLRLKGKAVWATPVVAGGHAYVVSHEGLVQVVRLGEEGTLVGTSQLDPGVLASPAVAGGAIYFRTDQHLLKVALPE
jgi:outer membrane protein assembly factor BamB